MMKHVKYGKDKSEPAPPHNPFGWQIVYTGFILIMLCFFLMLTSYTSLQQSRITRFVRAFSNAVSVFENGDRLVDGETIISGEAALINKEDRMARLFEKINEMSLESEIDGVDLHQSPQGVVMTLSDALLFDSGKAELTARAYPLLERIGRIIKAMPTPVQIAGHTDDRPIRTAVFDSNWVLSAARAVTVLRYLAEQAGVDVARLSAVGFSQYQPRTANDSEDHRASNRRVEIVFQVD